MDTPHVHLHNIYSILRRDVLKASFAAGSALSWLWLAPRPLRSAEAGPPKRGGILCGRGYDPVHFDPHQTTSFRTHMALSFIRSFPVVDMNSIHALIERIIQTYHPERIVLFGSYAYGTPTVDSDVDLLVVLPCEGKGARQAVEILNTVHPEFPVDLLVRTPEQVRQRLAWNDFFLREILEKGKILYEATHSRVG